MKALIPQIFNITAETAGQFWELVKNYQHTTAERDFGTIITLIIIIAWFIDRYKNKPDENDLKKTFQYEWTLTWKFAMPMLRWFCLLIVFFYIRKAILITVAATAIWHETVPKWILILITAALVAALTVIGIIRRKR